jgi:hypothetical protein
LGVRSNLLVKPVHVDDYLTDFGVREGACLAARHHYYLFAERVLDQKLDDAPADVPRRAQHDHRVLRLYRCGSKRHSLVAQVIEELVALTAGSK